MILDLDALAAALPRGGRLLGLDLGTKTIGMAVSDPGLVVASPIGTIKRTKLGPDLVELTRVIKDYAIAGIVLGLPLNMDGSAGPRADATRSFADVLAQRGGEMKWSPRITLWDERLSTVAVERFMLADDMTRKRRGEVVDKMAAAYILQGALDALAHRRRQAAEAAAELADGEDGDEDGRDSERF